MFEDSVYLNKLNILKAIISELKIELVRSFLIIYV